MATKYVLRSFKPGEQNHNHINPLINLSSFGLQSNQSIMKNALAISASQTRQGQSMDDQIYPSFYDATGTNRFIKYKDLTKNQSSNYAYYDMTYATRCQYCRQLARDVEINFLLETICNEAVVNDENGQFVHLNIDKLKLFLNKGYENKKTGTNADKLINDVKIAFNRVYSAFGWENNNGAWNYFKKFLVEGFLAFEIVFDEKHKNIIGILNLDPTTLQPYIRVTEDGQELFIWYQFKGAANERQIPNSNIIYISWGDIGDTRNTNISYVEGLTRSFNMLRQLENSHLVWNIQNAQNRVKITVPVGDLAPNKAQSRINQIIADYTEEVSMDDMSGQLLVNGEPKFNFQKTYIFEDRGGSKVEMENVKAEGYNMNTTEELQYFWRKFILESQVPANRFNLNIAQAPNNALNGEATITREEYAFSRFIGRIQNVFKEIILKPLLVQICLMHPEFSYTDVLKQGLGIEYNEENLFTLAKKRAAVTEGANTVSSLLGLQGPDQKPYFALDFLVKEYLGLSDDDLELNRKYKEAEILKAIETAKLIKKHSEEAQTNQPTPTPMGVGMDMGGGMNFGTGNDVMSGGEFGGSADMGGGMDMGGGDMGAAPEAAPAPEPAPAPEGGETM